LDSGFFITFEGIEGSGKTTQARLLVDYFAEINLDAILTFEPGGTDVGERVRDIVLDRRHHFMPPRVELLLYSAARAQHVEEIIRPALSIGRVVLCDRFTDSTLAYQGYGSGMERAVIQRLNEFATGGLLPDLTILLDFDPSSGMRRKFGADTPEARATAGDRIEARDLRFHQRVREGYLALAQEEPRRIVILDALQPADVLHAAIRHLVMARAEVQAILKRMREEA
jgi:dTMP kinase